MKHTHNTLFSALLVLTIVGSAFFWGQMACADGGQVTTNGIIGFYEESTDRTTESSTSEPILSSSDSEPAKVIKPKGRLPSTGEIVSNPFVWTGVGVLLAAIIVFFLKRSKKRRQIEEDNYEEK